MRVDQSEGQTGSDQAQTRNALNDDFHYSGNTGNMVFLVGDFRKTELVWELINSNNKLDWKKNL